MSNQIGHKTAKCGGTTVDKRVYWFSKTKMVAGNAIEQWTIRSTADLDQSLNIDNVSVVDAELIVDDKLHALRKAIAEYATEDNISKTDAWNRMFIPEWVWAACSDAGQKADPKFRSSDFAEDNDPFGFFATTPSYHAASKKMLDSIKEFVCT